MNVKDSLARARKQAKGGQRGTRLKASSSNSASTSTVSPLFRADKTLDALYENMEVLTGQRGEGAAVVMVTDSSGNRVPFYPDGSGGTTDGSGSGSGSGGDGGLTPAYPSKPTGLVVNGGFSVVELDWDVPVYYGHSLTQIWRCPEDNLSEAVQVGSTAANIYSDPIDPVYEGYYWIRFVNSDGVTGPYNASEGTYVKTQESTPYRSAVKSITDALSKNPDQLNSAENLRNLNTVLAPELNRGVGEVDPGNGKTVAGREITGVIPSPDGKLISPKIKLTYSDGSTAEGPLSKFGTTHLDDPLIAIPKEAAGKQMFARAAASALISSSPNAKALGGAGKNTVRQQVAGKIADLEEKRIDSDSKLRAGDIGGDVATHKTVLDNINANDKQYQDLEQHLYSVYGVTPPATEDDKRAEQSNSDALRQRLTADKDYPGFKQVMTDKKWDVDTAD
ncbi:hypothetical protein [Citrobacter freundii]|uniref:hypothetical protein n=1 Tax=Citrobacter freundii TaxID=546 RepID=UPI0021C9F98F|nr:hypothetical protein [Citrobacter freundii]MCU0184873.1 hypothetical protein [Citrobacter freundii]